MEILSVFSKLSQNHRKIPVFNRFWGLRMAYFYQKLFHMKHWQEFFVKIGVSRETFGAKSLF